LAILLLLYAMVSWLALAVNVLVQLAVCRAGQVANRPGVGQIANLPHVPRWSLMRSIYVGFLAGLAVVAAAGAAYLAWGPRTIGDALCSAALNVMTYGALGFGYFHFLNLGETARRIRIIREIDAAGRSLTRAEILERYAAESIVNVRINRLLAAGQIVFREGRYYLAKPTVLYMARVIVLMKLLVLGKRSEFA
jgi:hypothetical protein